MEKSKNRKNAMGTAVGIAVAMLVSFIVKEFVFAPPSFDKVMKQAASELNESCPMMIDEDTRLDNAVAFHDSVFQYNYTLVNWVKDSIDLSVFEEYMQPVLLNGVKTNPDLKMCRDNKMTMAYNYKDMNGEFMTKISITAEQYLASE